MNICNTDLIELTYNLNQIDVGNFLYVVHGGVLVWHYLIGESRNVVLSALEADLPYNSGDTDDDLCSAVIGNMIGNMDADVYTKL